MKTKIIFTALALIITGFLNAQLKVASSGNVGLQLGASTPLSPLSIGGVGSAFNKVDITSGNPNTTALNIYQVSPGSGTSYGINSIVTAGPSVNIGIKGQCLATNPMPVGESYGVLGIAGNHTSGYNYGVYGTISGYTYGAGIVGTTNGGLDVNVPGSYAGYFFGEVRSTANMYAPAFVVLSDKRLKINIEQLDISTSLNAVLSMNPVGYNLKQRYNKSKNDTTSLGTAYYDEKSQLFQKKQFGLIAQELQGISPDLVYQDAEGYLAVNYTGIIPLLIQSIKELKSEVETLKSGNSSKPAKVGASQTPILTETDALTYPVLDQNVPNPFNQSTTIGFYLPTTVTNANIYVYDMNGIQLKNYSLTERGKGNLVIQGSELNAGMYLYALIADGKVIDTKRMILTK